MNLFWPTCWVSVTILHLGCRGEGVAGARNCQLFALRTGPSGLELEGRCGIRSGPGIGSNRGPIRTRERHLRARLCRSFWECWAPVERPAAPQPNAGVTWSPERWRLLQTPIAEAGKHAGAVPDAGANRAKIEASETINSQSLGIRVAGRCGI